METNELTLPQVRSLWRKALLDKTNTRELFLYIDNPFCITKCKYCIYSPQVNNIGGDIYNRYYDSLIELIEDFKDILALKPLKGVYFGGGTASAMSTKTMRKVFDSIPNFRNLKYKGIECNPSITHDAKIDILLEYGFTYVSFGIQSLNKDLVESQNRCWYNIPRLVNQIKLLKSKGVTVNCDLLAFMETGEVSDLEQLYDDLCGVTKTLKPTWINIYPMYQRFKHNRVDRDTYTYDTKEDRDDCVRKSFAFRKTIGRFLRKHPDYHVCMSAYNDISSFLEIDKIEANPIVNFCLSNHSAEEINSVPKYNSSGYPNLPLYQDVIALGGLMDRRVYSYSGDDFRYYIHFDLDDNNFKFESFGG